MVSKCANPGCASIFLYLHSGKLFRVEIESPGPKNATSSSDFVPKKPPRRVEFFWLCEECASKMTLTFRKDSGVRTQPIVQAKAAAL
jgi:hypothetical protein